MHVRCGMRTPARSSLQLRDNTVDERHMSPAAPALMLVRSLPPRCLVVLVHIRAMYVLTLYLCQHIHEYNVSTYIAALHRTSRRIAAPYTCHAGFLVIFQCDDASVHLPDIADHLF